MNWERFLGDAPKVDFSVSRFFQWRMYWDYAGGPATDLLVHTFTPVFCILELDFPQRVMGVEERSSTTAKCPISATSLPTIRTVRAW